MATGDTKDFASRLLRVLPKRWFSDQATVLPALLNGLGAQFADVWTLLQFLKTQTRVETATGAFLDEAAVDFLGTYHRYQNEPDSAFSYRLRREVFRPRDTRAAIVEVLQDLTGNTPTVFRSSNPPDTGGYGVAMGYGVAGGYGSLALPFQAFVKIALGTAPGTRQATVTPGPLSGYGSPLGGYGMGALSYGTGQAAQGAVTDADIYAAVASVTPAGHVFWTQITGG